MKNTQKEILSYIENILTVVVAAFFFLFPLIFSSAFTDLFAVPKQLLIGGVVGLCLLLIGIRMIFLGKVQLRSTPFDLPVFLFTIVAFVSAIFAVNRYDSLINFMPFLFAALMFFVIVNSIRDEKTILFSISALVAGASVASIISVLSYLKIYVFPYAETQVQSFSTFGALLDQAMYLAIVLPFAGYVAWPYIGKMLKSRRIVGVEVREASRRNMMSLGIGFTVGSVLLVIGLGISLLLLFTSAKPIILPFETGFQTGFAAISQDAGRILQGFLFGSGYGTYLTDFTRFKQASYNTNIQLWSFTFFRSSSFILELLATTGIAGLISFLFIGYRFLKERAMFLPLVLLFIASLLLPFSYTLQVLFFVVLGLFAATQALSYPKRYEDLEYYFVAMKRGLIAAIPENEHSSIPSHESATSRILPFIAMTLLVVFVGIITYLSGRYVLSDIALKRALDAASQNNGLQTYNSLRDAIQWFPYRDTNYRIFSQTNLALANSLAASQPQGQQISQDTQQTILTLIQQAITAGRNAVTVSSQTSLNWDNLSNIYRSLIGFGQNADQFAVATNQEAIRLDPANPQQYINLGGIFYQLQQWDQAQNQFQIAIHLKPDLANAYYNLGHALESKGDLQGALTQYQAVRSLMQNDQQNLKLINDEIATLEKKIGNANQANSQTQTNQQPAENQPPLGVNEPQTQLPERQPLEKIPGPSESPSPSPKTSGTPVPSQAPTETPAP